MKCRGLLSLALSGLLGGPAVFGQDAEELLAGVNRERATCNWELRASLTHRTRDFEQRWALRVLWVAWDRGSASLATVLDPPEIRGTSRLVLEDHGAAPDRIWVMLSPRTEDVLPVGEHLRGEGLLAADFSHDDEQRWIAPEHYELRRLSGSEEDPPGTVAVEGVLRGDRWLDFGYSRAVWWLDPKRREIVRARFFETDGRLLKELEVLDWIEQEECVLPRVQRMSRPGAGSVSELRLESFERLSGVSAEDFAPTRLPAWARRMLGR